MRRAFPLFVWASVVAIGISDCGAKNGLGVDEDQIKNLGTMSALANGRSWAATDPEGHTTAFGQLLVTDAGDSVLHLIGPCWDDGDTLGSTILIDIRKPIESTFELRHLHTASWLVTRCVGPDTLHGGWGTDPDHGGTAVISKLDASKGTVIGTFAFDAFRGDSQTTVTILNGHFDLPYTVEHVTTP